VAIFEFQVGIFRGLKKMQYILYSQDVFRQCAILLLLIIVVLLGERLAAVMASRVLGNIFTICFASWLLSQDAVCSMLKSVKPVRKITEFIGYSFPLAIATVVKFARHRFDILLVGFLLNPSDVGLYTLAMTLGLLLTLPLTVINRILLPVASELFSKGLIDELRMTYKVISRWGLTSVLPILLGMVFFAEELLHLFFGPQFVPAAGALRIVALGAALNTSMGSYGEYLQSFGLSRPVMGIGVLGTCLNIALVFMLVPSLEIEGAALAFSVSILFMNIAGLLFLVRHKRVFPFSRAYLTTLVTGLGVFTPLFSLVKRYKPDSLEFVVISAVFLLGVVLYLILLNKVGCLSDEDKELVRHFITRRESNGKSTAVYES
jgi:O-antigen/teichoic acid export membrane protein